MNKLTRSLIISLAMLVGLAIAVPDAYAGPTLYKAVFEPPRFFPGVLVGQDNWIAPPPLSPNAAVVFKPKNGKQSVLVPGANLVSQDFIN